MQLSVACKYACLFSAFPKLICETVVFSISIFQTNRPLFVSGHYIDHWYYIIKEGLYLIAIKLHCNDHS